MSLFYLLFHLLTNFISLYIWSFFVRISNLLYNFLESIYENSWWLNSQTMLFFVRFEVFTGVTMKDSVSWDVGLCRSCVNRCLEERIASIFRVEKSASEEPAWAGGCRLTCSCWFLTHRFFYPEDGSDTFLRNVGSHNIYRAPHPRRRHSSCCFFFVPIILILVFN
jgi:hypothetical protein